MSIHYGASAKTVDNWTLKAGFPGGTDGPWRSDEVDRLLETIGSPYAPSRAGNGPAPVTPAKGEAMLKTLKLREQHRKLKLENDRLEGQLVYRDQFELAARMLTLRIKSRLEAIPGELEMAFPAEQRPDLKRSVANKIALILREMAAWRFEDEP